MPQNEWEHRLDKIKAKLQKHPLDGEIWLEYGDFLSEECDNPEKAIEAYKKAGSFLPGKDLRLRFGVAYDKAGRTEEGISLIKESLAENPRPNGYCILADVYLNNDMIDDAEVCCKKALELDANYGEAFYLLAEATKNKSRDNAAEYFRKAISIDNDYQEAWLGLGRMLVSEKSSREEGISALRKAIKLDPHDGWPQIYLANALWNSGDFEEAEKWYKSAISIFPNFPELRKWYDDFLKSKKHR